MQKDEAFTAEEDDKLKSMKADSKTWKEIAAEMKRPQNQLKARFKELNKNEGADGNEVKDKGAKAKQSQANKQSGANAKNKSQDQQNKAADQKNDVKRKNKGEGNAGKATGAIHGNGEARFTMGEWLTLQEDDFFSFGELQCLSELLVRDDGQKWLRIASSFYNKTGRRVHPDDIKEKFEELASLEN